MYRPDLENNVTVSLIELPMEGLVHLDGYKVFNLPNRNTRDLAHILQEELRVIQLRFLQVLVPSFGFQIRVFQVSILLKDCKTHEDQECLDMYHYKGSPMSSAVPLPQWICSSPEPHLTFPSAPV